MSGPRCSDEMLAHMALLAALRSGDLEAARAALGDTAGWPNCREPYLESTVLGLALGTAPLATVRELLAMGADPDYATDDGFPAIVETVILNRPDRIEIIEELLNAGADIERRGINNWTPLQAAAAGNDAAAVRLLLSRGADIGARTGIDDDNTALEEAEMLGSADAAAVLRSHGGGA